MAYTIKDAAALTGLSAYTIRYYEDSGIVSVGRDEHGNRIFDEADLEWLRYVTCLKVTGMSIVQMRRIAELTREGDASVPERRRMLEAHRKELHRKMDALHEATDCLEHKIACYASMEERLASAGVRRKEATTA
jgi:MerR family transcriptional regulator, aldehyde-responsive regulator